MYKWTVYLDRQTVDEQTPWMVIDAAPCHAAVDTRSRFIYHFGQRASRAPPTSQYFVSSRTTWQMQLAPTSHKASGTQERHCLADRQPMVLPGVGAPLRAQGIGKRAQPQFGLASHLGPQLGGSAQIRRHAPCSGRAPQEQQDCPDGPPPPLPDTDIEHELEAEAHGGNGDGKSAMEPKDLVENDGLASSRRRLWSR